MTHHDNPNDRLSPWHILAGFGWGILACLLITLLCGCKSIRYVPVESHTTDTLYQVKTERDSIHTTDSIYIHEWASVTGDTIYKEKERWRYLYRDRWRVDTLYKSHTDTIAVPYPVEKPLTRWQQFCLDYGKVTTGATAALILLLAVWLIRKVRHRQ